MKKRSVQLPSALGVGGSQRYAFSLLVLYLCPMRFEHPVFLHFLWALPFLGLLLWRYRQWRQLSLQRLGNSTAVQNLIEGYSAQRFRLKNVLLAAALILLAVAWANPQGGSVMRKSQQKSADVFIALDISQSMWATDVQPNRLERSKAFLQKLLQALASERVGIIFYAGEAFLQMPLSTDAAAQTMLLRSADPALLSAQGTASAAAIALGVRTFGSEETAAGRAIVLVSDGEDHDEDAIAQARKAYGEGIVVFTVGVGTPTGAAVPMPGGVLKRDEKGNVVQSKLNERNLYDMAHAGGGAMYNVNQGDAAIEALKKEIDRLQKRPLEVRNYADMESYFQWWLLPAVLLLLLDAWLPWRTAIHK